MTNEPDIYACRSKTPENERQTGLSITRERQDFLKKDVFSITK